MTSNTLRYFSLREDSYFTNYLHVMSNTLIYFSLRYALHFTYTLKLHIKHPLVLFTATRLILPIPTLQFKHAGVPFPHCCVTSRSLRAASCLSRSHPNHPLTIAATPGRSGTFLMGEDHRSHTCRCYARNRRGR